MKPYADAHNLEIKEADIEDWRIGAYVHRAISSVFDNCLSKNPKVKYFEKPFSLCEQEHELTQEEADAEIRRMIAEEDRWISKLQKSGI